MTWRCATCAGVVLALALTPALAQLEPVEIPLPDKDANVTTDGEKDGWPLGRVMGLNTEPVVGARLEKVAGSGRLLGQLAAYMEDVVTEKPRPNCAVDPKSKWAEDLKGFAVLKEWPLAASGCVSSIAAREEEREMTRGPHELMEMAEKFSAMQKESAKDVVGDFRPEVKKLFKNPNIGVGWKYKIGRFKACSMQRVSAVRFRAVEGEKAQWYFLTTLTNVGQSEDLADTFRLYVNEYVGVDSEDKFVAPLGMKLRKWDGTGGGEIKASEGKEVDGKWQVTNKTKRSLFASSFERWGGRVSLSGLTTMPEEDSPALILALDKADGDAGQAQDAITPSNIAILALPMALNIIPVALVADVSSIGLFVYTIMTDVLTTVPFIIKGFELFISGSKSFAAQDAWSSEAGEGGKEGELGAWIVVEAWGADCRLDHLRGIGSIFLAVGFAMLFFGVFFEWQAQRLRSRWIANGTLIPYQRHQLKADGLEPDMRMTYGLSPHRPSNQDVADEEQSFLDHQVVQPPPAKAGKEPPPSSSSTFSSATTMSAGSRQLMAKLSGNKNV